MFAYDKKDSYTFSFTSPDELRKYCEDNGYEIPFSKDLSLLGKELKVSTRAGEKVLKNRLVTHPMEGFDGETNGAPGELTRRRYHRFASSGAALIWSEAISIVPEGRTSDHQLFIADHNLDQFKSLMAEIREISDAPVMAQLTHSGRFSKNSATPHPIFATRSLPFEAIRPGDKDIPVVTDDYLDRLPEIYANAAKLAVEAGFDGIDIKDVKLTELRSNISPVLQDTFLFNGTIEENISYAKPNATHEEIEEAAKAANIHSDILAMPSGEEI